MFLLAVLLSLQVSCVFVLIDRQRVLFRPVLVAETVYSTRYSMHKSSKLEQFRRISMAALNSKVRKAVIPVAGLGTRMLPATKAIPKEMLPLVDKPLIQYVVN